jgi:hypothetical protein
MGGRDRVDCSLRSAQAKSSQDSISNYDWVQCCELAFAISEESTNRRTTSRQAGTQKETYLKNNQHKESWECDPRHTKHKAKFNSLYCTGKKRKGERSREGRKEGRKEGR